MNAPPDADSTRWWEDPSTDWDTSVPAKVVDVLAYAYDTRDKVGQIASAVGVDWMDAPPAVSVGELWKWALRQAAAVRKGGVLDLLAVVIHDDGSSQFHVPLENLLGDRLGEVHARNVALYGLPPAPTTGLDVVVESLIATDPAEVTAGRVELQAITSVTAGMPNPRARVQAILDHIARTAMIEVDGKPSGTGFLVRNDLVLTAAHVFDARNWPPSPQRQATAIFDFEFAGRSYAESGTRVPVAELVTGSLPTPNEAQGIDTSDWDAPEDRLDYALLKLSVPVPDLPGAAAGGATRGHYVLSEGDYDFAAPSMRYMIMQHALGEYVQQTEFNGALQLSPNRTRIRYGGNTFRGSSGSAIVDIRGRLVGLHHSAGTRHNQGVPICAIARELLNGAHAGLFRDGGPVAASAVVSNVDPFATTTVRRRRPFVNRHSLRATMREMARKEGERVLAIDGESGSGVSYSYQLAMHIAGQSALCGDLLDSAPGGLRALRFDLRQYYAEFGVEQVRTELGVQLLMDLGIIDKPTDPLAQDARNILTLVRNIRARLLHSDKQWWMFFDSIDNEIAIKHGEIDELIHALIELAEEVPLRIVLAGRAAEEFAAKHAEWAMHDAALGLSRGDVEGWLRQRAEEEGRAVAEALLDAKLGQLFPPGPLPEPRRLALQLPSVLLEVLGS